jgi:alkanesulfonate monooxygenase SsuD/methylene tetrahydromethanopterin reductase-like flavin-dependent oxidoreductase (luciferase family)
LAYDFRNPPTSGLDNGWLYGEILDQIAWIDGLGFDLVWTTEHHFVEDGYLPSFVAAAGAIAARTKHVRISSDIVLLPFHNALRLAEDMAVLDCISNGRMEIGIGMGYAPHEFEIFGIPRSRRVSLTEEGIEVMRLAWEGERFSYAGKRYQIEGALVRPRTVQPGGPPIWIAAMSEGGAKRAARMRTHLLPQGERDAVLDPFLAHHREHGIDANQYRIGIIRPWLITDDKERDWPPVRDAERYKARLYQDWIAAAEDGASVVMMGPEKDKPIPQHWIVGDSEACYRTLREFIIEYGVTDIVSWGAAPGLDPKLLNESHQRFASEVMPRLKSEFGG